MPLMQIREGVVDTLVWGNGSAQFTLLHASATGPKSLTGLAERLSHADRRIVAPAFAGYGQTQMGPRDGGRLAVNQAIAEAVLQSRSSDLRVLFGHSMGGLVALLSAVDEARRGTPLDALVLYEPILVDLLDVQELAQLEARDWDRDAVDQLGHHVGLGDAEAGVRYFVEAWNETSWEALPGTARQQLIDNAENIMTETAAVSTCRIDRTALAARATPTLLLRGAQSPPFVKFANQAAAQALPDATQKVLPGCGHMGPLLKPAMVADAVERFLKALASREAE